MGKRETIQEKYLGLLTDLDILSPKLVPLYAEELTRRHRGGWTIPTSTYSRCKEILFYKESLGRTSPYYVDLLKVEDRENLKIIFTDLCKSMRCQRVGR